MGGKGGLYLKPLLVHTYIFYTCMSYNNYAGMSGDTTPPVFRVLLITCGQPRGIYVITYIHTVEIKTHLYTRGGYTYIRVVVRL